MISISLAIKDYKMETKKKYNKWNKCLTAITVAAVLMMSGGFSTFAQEAKNSEEALKKAKTHDNVDPEYSQPMGQSSTAGTTDALLKVNHANKKKLLIINH